MQPIRKNILVSIFTQDYSERIKLEGVLQYAHEKSGARWDITLDLGDSRTRKPDGIIAYVRSDRHRQKTLDVGVPTVLIEDLCEPDAIVRRRDVVTFFCDHFAEGDTAARYFLSRHFKNFAFVGNATIWSRQRETGFRKALEKEGYGCLTASIPAIAALPRPCAVFAARDILARRVLSAAEETGVSVPDELAVLGVDDDEVLCTTSSPTLSSIPTSDHSLGYAAGRALNELLTKGVRGRVITTRHNRVITRASTDRDAIDDSFVARAVHLIRVAPARQLSADSLAKSLHYARRSLELRFQRALGTTLSETIRQIRLSRAKDMLVNTTEPIASIAEKCGYASVSHLSMRLKESENQTPLSYRRKSAALQQSGSSSVRVLAL